jgi:hypothetical protein
MKSILFCLTALVVTISACQHTKDPNTATLDFSQPTASNSDFIFSTCQGKTLIMADASAAQKISNNLKEQTGGILSDMGVGNAFVLNMDGKPFLCTATHGAVGLEKYTRKIGADIAVIDYTTMTQEKPGGIQLSTAYGMDTVIHNADSVFIRGYLFDKKGELQSVTISGVGRIVDKNEYGNNVTGSNKQYMQQRALIIKLDENVELAGLSGSPAFNKQGKVIGVYSGRTVEQDNGKDTYYIRVSLFN